MTVLQSHFSAKEARGKMFAEGIYRIHYHGQAGADDDVDWALAVLRDGQIMGSDKHGGVFIGSYALDRETGLDIVKLHLEVPPDGMLVTGLSGGSIGTVVAIAAVFEPGQKPAQAIINIEGQPIEIELDFVGPLPN
jgi:hypothetical protein